MSDSPIPVRDSAKFLGVGFACQQFLLMLKSYEINGGESWGRFSFREIDRGWYAFLLIRLALMLFMVFTTVCFQKRWAVLSLLLASCLLVALNCFIIIDPTFGHEEVRFGTVVYIVVMLEVLSAVGMLGWVRSQLR
jgi:hypothetical protein